MPNVKELINLVGQTISERKNGGRIFFYDGSHIRKRTVSLSPKTSVQCNFPWMRGKSTGVYRFKTALHGLTTSISKSDRRNPIRNSTGTRLHRSPGCQQRY